MKEFIKDYKKKPRRSSKKINTSKEYLLAYRTPGCGFRGIHYTVARYHYYKQHCDTKKIVGWLPTFDFIPFYHKHMKGHIQILGFQDFTPFPGYENEER